MVKIKQFTALALILLFNSCFAFANFLYPENTTYKIHQSDGFRIIYSDEYRHLIPLTTAKIAAIREIYNKEYNWTWDEEVTIILASSQNELTNGFATQYPNLFSAFFPGGPEIIDDFAIRSWLDVLLTHEVVHLYQLNARRSYSSALKSAFGNANPLGIWPPFTYMITPNIFTPTFLMEGNAVMNEVRFLNGGRLYSPMYRALTLQLIKNQLVNPKRLINDHIDYPYTTEKYIVGGYLLADIADRHSIKKANSWFYTHADRFINPFRINQSFVNQFNERYEVSISEFNKKYQKMALEQKSTPSAELKKSLSHETFLTENDSILFLTNSGKTWPELCKLQIKTLNLICKKSTLSPGELLRLDSKLVTSQIGQSTTVSSQAGLYDETRKIISGTEGKYYYSVKPAKEVYILVKESFNDPKLYVDGVFYDATHSSPWISETGDIYYFKQVLKDRILIKNKTELYRFKGYASRLVHVTANGSVYFVGATDKGGTVFKWSDKNTTRVTESDTVIDAALINEKSILVAEQTHEGISYKIASVIKKSELNTPENPVFYQYKYIDSSPVFSISDVVPDDKTSTNSDLDYSPLGDIKFSAIDPFIFYGTSGLQVSALASFADPLLRNQLLFGLAVGEHETGAVDFSYTNQVFRLGFFIFAGASETAVTESSTDETEEPDYIGNRRSYSAGAGVIYPIYSQGFWNSNFSTRYRYEGRGSTTAEVNAKYDTYFENAVITQFDLSWKYSPFLHWGGYRGSNIEFVHKYRGEKSSWEDEAHIGVVDLNANYDVYSENIFYANYRRGISDSLALIELNQNSLGLSNNTIDDPTDFSTFSDFAKPDYFELAKTSFGYIRPIHWGYYFQKFPFSLRRFALILQYNQFSGRLQKNLDFKHLYYEGFAGLELELLLLHKFPTRVLLGGSDSSVDALPSQIYFRLGSKWDF